MSLCAECGAEMGSDFEDVHRYHHDKWLRRGDDARLEEAETQSEGKPIDTPHPLYVLLWRVAVALEEQNRFNWEWMALNKAWHEENKASDIGPRMLAIHEQNAQREQVYREEMLHTAEAQVQRANKVMQASYEAYLESLRSPSKELVQAVQEALVQDIRRSTGARER